MDAFLGGKLSVAQPKTGFRAGLDSVLLGAAVPAQARSLLDLGAGAGVAGLVALAHNERLTATFLERDGGMAEIARHNVAGNGLSGRAEVIVADVAASAAAKAEAGVKRDHFDVVIANPPFFGNGTRAPDAARAAARHAGDAIDIWVKAAVSAAHASGEVIFIHTAETLPALLDAFGKRMGGLLVLPIAPRPAKPASRVLVRGLKGSRAPLTLLPPLVLHNESGNAFAPRAEAIFRGTGVLDWLEL